jgi:hypothetical protein
MTLLMRMSIAVALCGVLASCSSAPKPAPEPTKVTPAAEPAAAEPAPVVAEPVAAAAPAPPPVEAESNPVAKPVAASAYKGADPCTVAGEGKGPIDKACAKGGIKEAKAVMKSMVKKAKKGGMKVDCDSCHSDEKDWSKFTPDVKEKFKALIEASNK